MFSKIKDKVSHHHTEKVEPMTHENRGVAVPTNPDGSATAYAGSTAAHTMPATAGAGGYNVPAATAAAGVVGPEVVVMPGTSAGVSKPVYIPVETLPPGVLHVHDKHHHHHHATGLVTAGDERAAAGPVGQGGVAPAAVGNAAVGRTPDGHPIASPLEAVGYTYGHTPVIGVTDAAAPVLIPGIPMAAATHAHVPVEEHHHTKHVPIPIPVPIPVHRHRSRSPDRTTVVEIHDYSPEQSRHHVPVPVPIPVPIPHHGHEGTDRTVIVEQPHEEHSRGVVPVPVPVPVGHSGHAPAPVVVETDRSVPVASHSGVIPVPVPVGGSGHPTPVPLTTADVRAAPAATGAEHIAPVPNTAGIIPVPVPVGHSEHVAPVVIPTSTNSVPVAEHTRDIGVVPVPVGVTATGTSHVAVPVPGQGTMNPVPLVTADVLGAPAATGHEHIASIPRTSVPVIVGHGVESGHVPLTSDTTRSAVVDAHPHTAAPIPVEVRETHHVAHHEPAKAAAHHEVHYEVSHQSEHTGGAVKPASSMVPGPVVHSLEDEKNPDFTDNHHSIRIDDKDIGKIDVPADHGY